MADSVQPVKCEHRRRESYALPKHSVAEALKYPIDPTALYWIKVTRCLDCGEQW